MTRVFIVEDNKNITEALESYLELEDYETRVFYQIIGVMEAIKMLPPDLIVLDVMLPDGDGFVLARKIKRDYDIPIIFLTARVSESDRITGLELGADDYVIKPFSTKELVLRIKAVIKRTSSQVEKKIINTWGLRGKNDVLEVDVETHSLRVNGNIVDLTPGEWKILNRLIENPGIVLSREKLLASALDYLTDGSERTIDTHIKNIRIKLGDSDWIDTVRGFGYRFNGKENE